MEGEIDSLLPDLKAAQFDYIIDLHHNLRTLRLKWHLGLPTSSFPKLNLEKWLLTNFKINRLPDQHIVDRYFETVKSLGVENDQAGLDYFIPETAIIQLSKYGLAQNEYIAFAIGAKFATKRLPVEKMIDLVKKINAPIVLLGGKEDRENGEYIVDKVGKQVYNACGQYSLHGSASWVQQSRLLLTHDTGLMHIGAALKKPIISVWGNTVPAFGMYPYQTEHHIIEVHALSCRPCSKIGSDQCPKGHFRCMAEIDNTQILDLIHSYFSF